MTILYDSDYFAWAKRQADLLRAGELHAVDIARIAAEIEGFGRRERRELFNRLSILIMYFLKWCHQPLLRSNSWRATIDVRRRQLKRLLSDSPSFRDHLPTMLADAYGDAVLMAASETGLAEAHFPGNCPWDFHQLIDHDFWPD